MAYPALNICLEAFTANEYARVFWGYQPPQSWVKTDVGHDDSDNSSPKRRFLIQL
jgi:hypothetical protein